MVQHTCEICSKVFEKSSQYKAHKERKTSCVPITKLAQNIHIPASTNNATPEQIFGVNHEPKEFDGTIIWKKTDESVADDDIVRTNSDKMATLMKRCHQILYNNGGVVGNNAMKDIMKVLMLKMLQPFFLDENSVLYKKVQHILYMTPSRSKDQFQRLSETSKNIRLLIEKSYGDPIDQWRAFVDRFLSRILPELYETSDYLNCRSIPAFIDLILNIDKIDDVFITDADKSGYDTICGQIYENFINGYMKGDKVLGQMFTPRNMIHLILEGVLKDNLKDKKDMTIYDPCMGSGGFLCLTKRMMGDKVVKIVGSDIGKDPFSFGYFNVLMTTGRLPENLYFEDTLKCYRPEKADLIITNPPFALKVKYQQKNKDDDMSNGIKDMYDSFRGKREDIPKFEDVYPFKTNSGVCLFIQHCIHKLKEGGICAIVLPDGEVMTGGRGMANFRHWLCENANIKCIVSVPAGVFEHVGVKTAVIVFEKSGSTKEITFMQTNELCDEIVKVCDVSLEHMGYKKYVFDSSLYLKGDKQTTYGEGVVVKTLGEVCEFIGGKRRNANSAMKTGHYKFITCSIKGCSYLDTYDFEDKALVINSINGSGKCMIYCVEKYSTTSNNLHFKLKNTDKITIKYLYYYLRSNINLLEDGFIGSNQKKITKEYVQNIKIPIPPLEKQNEIVADCDLLFAQIQTLKTLKEQVLVEKQMYMKYELNQTRFLRNYQVAYHQIGDVCDIQYGTRIVKKNTTPGEYDVYGGGDKTFTTNTYNREGYTILVSRFAISKTCVRLMNTRYFLNDSGFTIKFKDGTQNSDRYLGYYLMSQQDQIYRLARGTAQCNMDMDAFMNLNIPIISQADQEQFISLFEPVIEGIKKFDHDLSFIEQKIQRIYNNMNNIFISI